MELITLVLTATYFTSKDIICQQKKCAAMSSPLSPIAVDLFTEWLEKEAIATAPRVVSRSFGRGTVGRGTSMTSLK